MTPDAAPARRRALITGVTGQDGYYLAQSLLGRGWTVFGGLAAQESNSRAPIEPAGLEALPLELTDNDSVRRAVQAARPDCIFHLAAQSHVPTSWADPAATVDVNTAGSVRLIEAMRISAPRAHLVLAGSSDCYDHASAPATGLTPDCAWLARTPYAVSKLAAMELARRMRDAHGLRISIAVLMNHTSPRRSPLFVERKIIREAVAVARGEQPSLTLGSLETQRDWSWAEDIVEGLRLMAESVTPADFVLGSGELRTTGDWLRAAFERLGLNERRHLKLDPSLLHHVDPPKSFGDIRPARRNLGWAPRVTFDEMVERLIEAEQEGGS
jgi:GDPmannose 4,6-dehydratase